MNVLLGGVATRLGLGLHPSLRARIGTPLVLGYLSAFTAAMAYGIIHVLNKKIVTDFANPLVAATFTVLFGTLVLALFIGKRVPGDIKTAPRKSLLFMALAGITATTGLVLSYIALTQAPVVIVAPVASINPLIALLFAHLFLRNLERITPRIVLGALLVLAGVVTIAVTSV